VLKKKTARQSGVEQNWALMFFFLLFLFLINTCSSTLKHCKAWSNN